MPDRIIQVPAVPTTLTGKKLEVPARRILLGTPVEQAADRSTVADPRALDALARYARTQRNYPLTAAATTAI